MADKFDSFQVRGLPGAFGSLVFDEARQVFTTQKAIDGNALVLDPPMASIVEVSGSDTYICEAPAGTPANTGGWRCQKISVSGGTTTITWADDGKFTQVASQRTSLSYS